MKTIKIHLTIGYPAADRRWETEVSDDATEDEINEIVKEEVYNYIEYGWSEG